VNIDENPQVILGGARLLAEHGLELDLNGPPSISAHAEKLAAAVPDLRMVINHLGSAGDPQNISPQWKDGIAAIAQRPNVFMKVSALVEQTKKPEGQAPHEMDYYLPILDYLWQQFGAERLIFGSNWPVSDRGAPYVVLIRIVQQYFQSKGREALENYFWRNATRAYGVA
jgi:predicted TIM-barrel fold metal-dependent hydrolase